MEHYMVDLLVSQTAIVLQNVVVFPARCSREFLDDRKNFGQLIVWNVCYLFSVVLWHDKLRSDLSQCSIGSHLSIISHIEAIEMVSSYAENFNKANASPRTAWPLLRG